jgi:hypothetical protein
MNKPVKKSIAAYDYSDVIGYIEEKYNITTRKYRVGHEFWHWLSDKCFDGNIRGSSYRKLNIKEIIDDWNYENAEENPDWALDILKLIHKEFPEDEIEFWIY